MENVGVACGFAVLCNAQSDFASLKKRIVWSTLRSYLNAWTRSTFQKISSKWGELVELEDGNCSSDDESAMIIEQANNLEHTTGWRLCSDSGFGSHICDNGDVQGFEAINMEAVSILEIRSNDTGGVNLMGFLWMVVLIHGEMIGNFKRNYLESLITCWNGESLIMGDFNEVRCIEEQWGSVFNSHGANAFNSFIIIRVTISSVEGDLFHGLILRLQDGVILVVSYGLMVYFRLSSHFGYLSGSSPLRDHRPILLKEVFSDFGPTPFRFYHSWLEIPMDFSRMTWFNILEILLLLMIPMVGLSKDLKSKLCDIDKVLDQGGVTDDILLSHLEVLKQLHDVQSSNNRDIMQKAKIRWAIEGDENSKYFHAIITKKTAANLSLKDVQTAFLPNQTNSSMMDYLDVVLSRWIVPKWRSWIRGKQLKRIFQRIQDCPFYSWSSFILRRGQWFLIGSEESFLGVGDKLSSKTASGRDDLIREEEDVIKLNKVYLLFFRRHVRGGVESQQLDQLSLLLDTVILSNMDDRWFWDLNGDGVFQVKDVRSMLDVASEYQLWNRITNYYSIGITASCLMNFGSGFEIGPGFSAYTSQGILLETESNLNTPSSVQLALDPWIVLGTVKYIDSNHYVVPQGCRAVELISASGSPSGISYNATYISGRIHYTLEFIMGDAGDSCVGDFTVVVLIGPLKWNFMMRSDGVGSSKKYSVKFQLNSSRSFYNVVPISFVSYNETRTSDHQELCGPVIDAMFLGIPRGLCSTRLPSGLAIFVSVVTFFLFA
ncbi:RNA-directed DNA polymerase, eukaryota [Tanacetum coccineum]